MRFNIPDSIKKWVFPLMMIALIAVGIIFRGTWWPRLTKWVEVTTQSRRTSVEDDSKHEDSDDHPHDSGSSLELSPQARLNIGLTAEFVQPIQPETYRRHITVPAIIVERPGRTRIEVSTPLTGIVTHVHSTVGEAIEPGTLLFEIRLTHEDLVQAQTRFLQSLGELDVESREIARLQGIVSSGAVAGKLVLERQYAIDKLTALLDAQREALRLHGLSDAQIEQVETDRRLLKSLQIFAPSPDQHSEEEIKLTESPIRTVSYAEHAEIPLIVLALKVHKGQSVIAGEPLCELADFSELFIEGRAFERDSDAVTQAVIRDWTATAVFESSRVDEKSEDMTELPDLKFAYLDNLVDQSSRTLSFFVRLPNQIVRDERNEEEQRYLSWKYRPGQRLQLRVPVEEWEAQFVLPVEAVTQEGAEYYVFQENGDHFDRIPVHVKYKDQLSVVIANDGSLFPGDVVARRGAHQMQMALKSKSGGAVDPHAGHTH
ncbi:MAG TPA: efflux RND transporter periplasmic adaptor subunit [Planctomycetaceae bacterium]|nr:efflux RND transporter periplasmic adaptor subunit [Planctomycetaceae bacterium]